MELQVLGRDARNRSQIFELNRLPLALPFSLSSSPKSKWKLEVLKRESQPGTLVALTRKNFTICKERRHRKLWRAVLTLRGLAGSGTRSFRKRFAKVAPPLPPGSYIRMSRHFRSLFHWRPTRRRPRCSHGKSWVRSGIWRHRSRDREGLLSERRKCPVLGARSVLCGALGLIPGEGRQSTQL